MVHYVSSRYLCVALKIAMDIAQGMCYLHGQNPPIIHRDFKSPNSMLSWHAYWQLSLRFIYSKLVLLHVDANNDIVAKIGDFGLSARMYSSSLQAEKARERTVANPYWLAPEILREEEYTINSDGMSIYAQTVGNNVKFSVSVWYCSVGAFSAKAPIH